MGVEYELKFAATAQQLEKLRQIVAPTERFSMETTYFDTPDGVLSARRMTLRLRRENDVTVCTVKTPLPDGGRGEWECFSDRVTVGIDMLCKLGAPAELLEWTAGGVEPICGARFAREVRQMDIGVGTVEIALDQGVLLGGGKELPFCEMEVELKSGDWAQAADFAACLAGTQGLKIECRSKFRRALALARGEEDGL